MDNKFLNDLFVPVNITLYLHKGEDGSGSIIASPDWKIEKVIKGYEDTITNRYTKKCICEGVKIPGVNVNFKLKIEDNSFYISHPKIADGAWIPYYVVFTDELVGKYFYESVVELTTKSPKVGDCYENISIAFSNKYPGVPFFVNSYCSNYRNNISNGSKYMTFTTASIYGSKRTKKWKPGYRYVDLVGNQFTIIGQFEIGESIYNLLNNSLSDEKKVKKYGSEREFIKTVVDIINSDEDDSTPTETLIFAPTTKSVYFYIKDNDTDFASFNSRCLDVYDDLSKFSIQILPCSESYSAFEVGEVFSEDVRKNNPLDLKQIAENTLKYFGFGTYTYRESVSLFDKKTTLSDRVIEELIYLSDLINPATGKKIPEITELLKNCVEEKLKEYLLFDMDGLDPNASYDKPIETIDVIKRSSIFMSKLLKHSQYFEEAVNYLNSNVLDFPKTLIKVKDEIKNPVDFLFKDWETYQRFVNYTTLPYKSGMTNYKLTVDKSFLPGKIEIPELDKVKFGLGLGNALERLINTALLFGGVGVQSYSVINDKEVIISITYNDIARLYSESGINDVLINDILRNKFFKMNIIISTESKETKEKGA